MQSSHSNLEIFKITILKLDDTLIEFLKTIFFNDSIHVWNMLWKKELTESENTNL